jgi:hypothetical protein
VPKALSKVDAVLTELPSKQADEIVLSSLDEAAKSLRLIRQERIRQARMAFNLALGLIAVGVLIIFAGIVLIFAVNLSAGVVTTACGMVTQVISAILFKFNGQTNDRLDVISRDLASLDRAKSGLSSAMPYIDQITDPKRRDQAIAELVNKLTVPPAPNKG